LEGIAARTRAAPSCSSTRCSATWPRVCHQIGQREVRGAEALLQPASGKLEDYVPRFRGLHVESLREDFQLVMKALREARAAGRSERTSRASAPARLPD